MPVNGSMQAARLRALAARLRKDAAETAMHGLFGVEFFVKGDAVIFSELSPRPHDTGMVTLVSQDLSEFDLHARAILGLPIPPISLRGASASAVVLADRDCDNFSIGGIAEALAVGGKEDHIDARIFGKPVTRPYRRMAVALARADSGSTDDARKLALAAAEAIHIDYQ